MKKVLIVEDDKALVEAYRTMLGIEGFEVMKSDLSRAQVVEIVRKYAA